MRREVSGGYLLDRSDHIGLEVGKYDHEATLIVDPEIAYSILAGLYPGEVNAVAVDLSGNVYLAGKSSPLDFPGSPPVNLLGQGGASVIKLNPEGSAVIYATYIGGSADDVANGIAVDAAGRAYITGTTTSTDFPVQNAVQRVPGGGTCSSGTPRGGPIPCGDAFVVGIEASGGRLVYSTYLGGSQRDSGFAIAVDAEGNAYVTGMTNSPDFPVATPLQRVRGGGTCLVYGPAQGPCPDVFVSKLSPLSRLIYSTYVGGDGEDGGRGIAVDPFGNTYVTGNTTSDNFPTVGAIQATRGECGNPLCPDALVFKLNPAGSALVYSTYLGGAGSDVGNGIAVDSAGSAYIVGQGSPNFPLVNPFQSSHPATFVAKLNSGGSGLLYSTFFGGGGQYPITVAYAIAVDSTGSAYITGRTSSDGLPVSRPYQSTRAGLWDAFITRFSADGSSLIYSTYLGGSLNDDWGKAISLDSSGNAYVAGTTYSYDFPATDPLRIAGQPSAFLTKIPAEGGTNPVPSLASASLASVPPDGLGLTLSVNGTGFVLGSVAQWNGSQRETRFISPDTLRVEITGSDVALPGAAQVTVSNPLPGGGSSNALTVTIGQILANAGVNFGTMVNGASFVWHPLAAGSIASSIGLNFSPSTLTATFVPLPTTLGGVKVEVNGIAAPLFAVTPQQINFQIPWEVLGQSKITLTVTTNRGSASAFGIDLGTFSPGLFSTNQQGTGQGAIVIGNTASVAAPVGAFPRSCPARRGETISIYGTGFGPVVNPPATGTAAASDPASTTTTLPIVTIGGVAAAVTFSGLAPGFVGLYQVNVDVSANAPVGDAVPVVLTIGGVTSNAVTIAIQ